MRIIAGEYRGRFLTTVRDHSVRPTTDRVKQALFDLLTHRIDFTESSVLDLFAGSGSLGLEALSRGAHEVVFVEKSRSSIEVLESNIAALDCSARCTIYPADVFWFLKNTHRSYDLVFVDPPYKLESIGTLPSAISASKVLKEGSYVIMEHSRESHVDVSPDSYEVMEKSFGQTRALILKAKPKASEHSGALTGAGDSRGDHS
ncbi:MAG TPA: 16S rRNA (guanine(966)-N(2))-methyltransferase RsmD [Bacteroidetes bacterium]|nr:16S rRNA (guanine(966)-N(2))-methyltransferase RsmD [Bacteroidota bacterium]